MRELDQILSCFPTVSDWQDIYLDDNRQRLLGEAQGISVEIILGGSLDHVGIFSRETECPEMLSVMEVFLGSQESASAVLIRARDYFRRQPDGIFHAILGAHTLSIANVGNETHFRVSPSTDS